MRDSLRHTYNDLYIRARSDEVNYNKYLANKYGPIAFFPLMFNAAKDAFGEENIFYLTPNITKLKYNDVIKKLKEKEEFKLNEGK